MTDSNVTNKVLTGRHRVIMVAGLVTLLVGAIDPLEGSLLILLASAFVTLAARWARSRHVRLLADGLVLTTIGFAAMWIMTAIGGVGGSTDHSAWWALLALPIIPGWIIGVVGSVLALREETTDPASIDGPGRGVSSPRRRTERGVHRVQ